MSLYKDKTKSIALCFTSNKIKHLNILSVIKLNEIKLMLSLKETLGN